MKHKNIHRLFKTKNSRPPNELPHYLTILETSENQNKLRRDLEKEKQCKDRINWRFNVF